MSEGRTYGEIGLKNIRVNSWNPRKQFSGPKYDELVASIRAKGVLEPILIRPVKPKKGAPGGYEIVAGERRYRAAVDVANANGGIESAVIPAMIQEMSDDDAFEVMTIENLQREDLTELEEARSFKTYLERKGVDHLYELAERCGIHPRYITRRVAVLALPEDVLRAWDEGKIKYGHCEQLIRLKDEKEILKYAKEIVSGPGSPWRDPLTVRRLKAHINDKAIELSWAKFDLSKEGCPACLQNSDVQKELFGEESEMDKTRCLDAACFRKKQGAWLTKNWKKFAKAAGTNGFCFEGESKWDQREVFCDYGHGEPGEKCAECPDFISIVTLRGKMEHKQVCTGDKKCYQGVARKKPQKETGAGGEGKTKDDGPRVAWHGEYFREEFYKTRLPEVWKMLDPMCDVLQAPAAGPWPFSFSCIPRNAIIRLAIMSILISNHEAKEPFSRRHIPKYAGKEEGSIYSFDLHLSEMWQTISALSPDDNNIDALLKALRDTALDVYMQKESGSDRRHEAALHLGIDLAREWRLNKDYLDKKTISEINAICERFGIFEDPKAQAFLFEMLGKKRGKFNTCKKYELIRVILESGIDLAGKVPPEILAVKDTGSRRTVAHYHGCSAKEDERTCRVCGCTQDHACEAGCSWVEEDLCSACQ